MPKFCCTVAATISIHAAREGGDHVAPHSLSRLSIFQSTPPVKAATENGIEVAAKIKISIHAAREGGDVSSPDVAAPYHISIHAAREGGDDGEGGTVTEWTISIHAAREGGDRSICAIL